MSYCCGLFNCTRPTPDRQYVKMVKFIAENPGSTRAKVNFSILGQNNPGTHTCTWSSIRDAGLIEMRREYGTCTYYVTDTGMKMLRSLKLAK